MKRSSSLARAALVSCVLAVPCFWAKLVSPADLQSHLYNAWLAQLVAAGQAPGLYLADQSTNVLVDIILAKLLPVFGVSITERAVALLLVLSFFWGTHRFVTVTRGKPAWELAPWLAMLTYGFVFQTGLLNFYASAGLMLWILSFCWTRRPEQLALCAPLLALAWLAHPIPVVWAACVLGYALVAERLPGRLHAALLAAGIAGLLLVRTYVVHNYLTRWSINQLALVTGADQMWLYGRDYLPVFAAFIALFIAVALTQPSRWATLTSVQAQLYGLSATAAALLPNAFRPSSHVAWSGVICQRLSLLSCVLLFSAMGVAKAPKLVLNTGLLIAALFFGLLYRDLSTAVRLERKIETLLAPLPPGERIISFLDKLAGKDSRVYYGDHLVARACLGRCYDYQNYEPATGQFRVRVKPGNPMVIASIAESYGLEVGMHRVKPSDPPLHIIVCCGRHPTDVCIRPIGVGERGLELSTPPE